MAKKQLSYNEAMKQLEGILAEIENNTLDVDLLGEKVQLASELIKICKEKLYKTEKDIQNIIANNEE